MTALPASARSLEERAERELALLGRIAAPARPERPEAVRAIFEPVDLAGLEHSTYTPAHYAVAGLIPRRHVTLLGGHGGMGKSMLALVLAAHVVCGREWAGLPTDMGRVLFVSLEDEGALVRSRLRHIARAYCLRTDWLEDGLQVLDGSSSDAALAIESSEFGVRTVIPTAAMEALRDAVTSDEFALIVIDNASDAFAGDENSRRQVRLFIRWLNSIARAADAAILLAAHIDKSAARNGAAGNSYSGSTAWHNSVRSRLALVDDAGPILHHEKANLTRRHDPIRLAFDAHGVLMPATLAGNTADADDRPAILAAMRQAIEHGTDVTAAMSGPVQACNALSPYLPDELAGSKDAKRRINRALKQLLTDGDLVIETFQNSHRHSRKRLALAQPGPADALKEAA